MVHELALELAPEVAFDAEALQKCVVQTIGATASDQVAIVWRKRSIDARSRQVKVHCQLGVYVNQSPEPQTLHGSAYKTVPANAKRVVIVGFGPAGMFAALKLIELGIKPIILERGKDVQARRRDLMAINRLDTVHPDSNYCFGEGGAGTYSDGKLYTRSNKRGSLREILEILVAHGASTDILVDTHPHIGTNKLPKIVAAMRETIIAHGGKVHFETKMVGISQKDNAITAIRDQHGQEYTADAYLLAVGHSARDVFRLLHAEGVLLEAKPFAIGVRAEHPQAMIDQKQYHRAERGILPPASYSLVHQTKIDGVQKGVFSFCMCPGGFIVPSATSQGELVVNGMSPSKRDGLYANSGIVVPIEEAEWRVHSAEWGPLAGMVYQEELERQFGEAAGGTQKAAAQRIPDFIAGKVSKELNDTSYIPGLLSAPMHTLLPREIAERLRLGFQAFGKQIRGYDSAEGQIIGLESRTSSPVRIPRTASYQHPVLHNLYPVGEGAGYAGGIVSAAMDGANAAMAIAGVLG